MIWLFERDDALLRIEARVDTRTKDYVVAIGLIGRVPIIERYQHMPAFTDRLRALEQQLFSERWKRVDLPGKPFTFQDHGLAVPFTLKPRS